MSQNNSAQPAGIQKGRKRSQHIEYSIFKHLNSGVCVTSNLVSHYCCCLILLIRIDPVSCTTSASLTEEKFPDIKLALCPPETFSLGLYNISITKALLCNRLCLFTQGKKKQHSTASSLLSTTWFLFFGFLHSRPPESSKTFVTGVALKTVEQHHNNIAVCWRFTRPLLDGVGGEITLVAAVADKHAHVE